MIIEKLILKNYRCYGETKIDFLGNPYSPDNPGITLFTGDNTTGKTTLFNAIGWAIYGRETQSILKREEPALSIPTKTAYNTSDTLEVKVELHIKEAGDIEKLILVRTAKFQKQSNVPLDSELILQMKYANGSDDIRSSKSDRDIVKRLLRQLFPTEIAAFHLFDGEFLEYTYTNKGSNIESGIRNLFRIGRIEELKDATEDLVTKYGRDRTKFTNNEKLQGILANQERKRSDKSDILKKIAEVEQEINYLKEERISVDKQLEELGNAELIKSHAEKLKNIESEIETRETKKKTITEAKRKIIFKNAYKFYAFNFYPEVYGRLDTLVQKGGIPPEIKDKFVEDLLQRGSCICGTDLTSSPDAKTTLQRLLKEIEGSSEKEALLDLYYRLGNSQKNLEVFRSQISRFNSDFSSLQTEILGFQPEKEELMEELKKAGSYEQQIKRFVSLKERREQINQEIEEKVLQNSKRDQRSKDIEEELKEIQKEIDKLEERNDRFKQYATYYKEAQVLNSIISEVVRNIFSEIATRYEEKVNELIQLIPILSQFKVEIDVADSDTGRMSFKFLQEGSQKFYMAGSQNQLMGILLIAAFTKVMRESVSKDISFPFVIIDNPVSTLSEGNIELFGKVLSELFNGVHLVLFVKNTDFNKILKGAEGHITKFYRLDKEQGDETTEVEEVPILED